MPIFRKLKRTDILNHGFSYNLVRDQNYDRVLQVKVVIKEGANKNLVADVTYTAYNHGRFIASGPSLEGIIKVYNEIDVG